MQVVVDGDFNVPNTDWELLRAKGIEGAECVT